MTSSMFAGITDTQRVHDLWFLRPPHIFTDIIIIYSTLNPEITTFKPEAIA